MENIQKGELEDTRETQQYIGEIYFFRAYIYFEYLRKFGDFPIIKSELSADDYAANVEANKRKPRNEVARFILEDLNEAIARLLPRSNNLTNHRLNRECAYLFKSRVALYEASWETYHQGTARVPGGPGWPGGTFNGNLNTEIDFFLTEAMASAKEVAEAIQISDKIEDYMNMFNQYDLSSNKEVLLWRMYSADAKVNSLVEGNYHSIYNENGEGCVGQGGGYTRSMVETFLTTNGLPIYAPENTEYKGDKSIPDVMENRDLRLVESTFKPGDMVWRGGNMDQDGRMVYANLLQAYQNLSRTATGYLVRKGWRDSNVAPADNSPLAYMIFRASEAYLNYMEADYMKNKNLDDYSKKYWRALRKRAG
ncbi:RagB/SusD family nutrient uptake outer membrane protein, partial [Bacteroides uniformis]